MIKALTKRLRLAILKRAIRFVEKSGLSVVQIKRSGSAVYLVAGNGQYVRFDRVNNG